MPSLLKQIFILMLTLQRLTSDCASAHNSPIIMRVDSNFLSN